MTKEQFINQVASMSAEKQNEFLAKIRNFLTAEEYEAICILVSFESMFKDPSKYYAMREAVKAEYVKGLYR